MTITPERQRVLNALHHLRELQRQYLRAYNLRELGEHYYSLANGARPRSSRRDIYVMQAQACYARAEKIWPLGHPQPTWQNMQGLTA